jgi:hypothetical protein
MGAQTPVEKYLKLKSLKLQAPSLKLQAASNKLDKLQAMG